MSGAGVIVTADPKHAGIEDVFGLLMENPLPVVWFLKTICDTSDEWIDRSAYHAIAQATV